MSEDEDGNDESEIDGVTMEMGRASLVDETGIETGIVDTAGPSK